MVLFLPVISSENRVFIERKVDFGNVPFSQWIISDRTNALMNVFERNERLFKANLHIRFTSIIIK